MVSKLILGHARRRRRRGGLRPGGPAALECSDLEQRARGLAAVPQRSGDDRPGVAPPAAPGVRARRAGASGDAGSGGDPRTAGRAWSRHLRRPPPARRARGPVTHAPSVPPPRRPAAPAATTTTTQPRRRPRRPPRRRPRRRPPPLRPRRRPGRETAATAEAAMTDATPKAKKRRRAATVPGVVVTAATLGTTGLAFAYSVKTAPATNTGKTAPGGRGGRRDRQARSAGIAQLHSSISSTERRSRRCRRAPLGPRRRHDGVRCVERGHHGRGNGARWRARRRQPASARTRPLRAPLPGCAGSRCGSDGRADRGAGGPGARRRRPPDAGAGADPDDDPHDAARPTRRHRHRPGDGDDRGHRHCLMAATSTVLGTTRAMATDVTVHGAGALGAAAEQAARDALLRFHDVDTTCTRFDPHSPLMRVNARPDRWHEVPPMLFLAIQGGTPGPPEDEGPVRPPRAPHARRPRVRPQPGLLERCSGDGPCRHAPAARRAVAATVPGRPAPAAAHRPRAGRSRGDRQGAGAALGVRAVADAGGRLPDRCRR